MTTRLHPLTGIALGAGLMYFFDPRQGGRRRALLRDQFVSVTSKLDDAMEMVARDLSNRTQGLMAETRAKFLEDSVADEVLVDRVHSAIGRVVSHPGAIEVKAEGGQVTLTGPVLAREHKDLLQTVESVRGVAGVNDHLVVHKTAEGVSALQGGRPRRRRPELMQTNWSPAIRFLMGAAGGSLVVSACARRDVLSLLLGPVGAAMFLRGVTNLELKRLFGIAAGRRAIDITKTVTVAAPVEQVFDVLTHYENFPQFMANVREVKRHNGTSHWKVAGPAGTSVEWDAETTKLVPNEVVAWKTLPGSLVDHAGMIRFEPVPQGTRLDIKMSYSPPGGAFGHVVAKLFGSDPKSELDEDLVRMKTFLETGKAPRDAAAQH
jgi:uncharacterized membrane protein